MGKNDRGWRAGIWGLVGTTRSVVSMSNPINVGVTTDGILGADAQVYKMHNIYRQHLISSFPPTFSPLFFPAFFFVTPFFLPAILPPPFTHPLCPVICILLLFFFWIFISFSIFCFLLFLAFLSFLFCGLFIYIYICYIHIILFYNKNIFHL